MIDELAQDVTLAAHRLVCLLHHVVRRPDAGCDQRGARRRRLEASRAAPLGDVGDQRVLPRPDAEQFPKQVVVEQPVAAKYHDHAVHERLVRHDVTGELAGDRSADPVVDELTELVLVEQFRQELLQELIVSEVELHGQDVVPAHRAIDHAPHAPAPKAAAGRLARVPAAPAPARSRPAE